MTARWMTLIGVCLAVGLAISLVYYYTRPLRDSTHGPHGVSLREVAALPLADAGVDASEAHVLAITPESLQRGAARDRYQHLLEKIRSAAADRELLRAAAVTEGAPAAPSQPKPPEPDYAPEDVPVPGTRTSDVPGPTPEEQHRFFDSLSAQADPLVDECYRALPEPRPVGTLKLVWTTIHDDDLGTVVERIEFDPTSELTDARVVECARESIFSVQLPNLEGYGRLQVSSRHQFDGQQLTDEDAPDPGGV